MKKNTHDDFNGEPCPECGAVVCGMDCPEDRGPGRSGSVDDGACSAALNGAIRKLGDCISDQGPLLADK